MMMNLLLINPAYPNTFWSFKYALKFIGKKAAYPPLGLLTVAAMLPGQFQTRLVDVNVQDLKEADLAWAQTVFISAMAVQRASAKKIIDRCRSRGLKVVAGGPLFTAEPEAFPEVDHLVLDEAELTLPPFLADLQNGQPKKIYRAAGFCDLGQTPIPDWGLVRMKNYASMSIQFSRGCQFNCDFCNVTTLFGHRVRMKTPLQVLAPEQESGSSPKCPHHPAGRPAGVGFDCDTPATFQRHIDFIQQSGIVTAMVGMLQALPGTRLFERLQKENRVVGQISGDNVDGTTNIVPKMGLSTLVEGYQTIMACIYSPRHYYQRLKSIKSTVEAKAEKRAASEGGQYGEGIHEAVLRTS